MTWHKRALREKPLVQAPAQTQEKLYEAAWSLAVAKKLGCRGQWPSMWLGPAQSACDMLYQDFISCFSLLESHFSSCLCRLIWVLVGVPLQQHKHSKRGSP